MKDKLNKFMQGRYGVDQFARFTLGVALFCIVIGSFLRTGIAGEILDMLGFILITESCPEMFPHVTGKIRNIWVIHRISGTVLIKKKI